MLEAADCCLAKLVAKSTKNFLVLALVASKLPWLSVVCREDVSLSVNTG